VYLNDPGIAQAVVGPTLLEHAKFVFSARPCSRCIPRWGAWSTAIRRLTSSLPGDGARRSPRLAATNRKEYPRERRTHPPHGHNLLRRGRVYGGRRRTGARNTQRGIRDGGTDSVAERLTTHASGQHALRHGPSCSAQGGGELSPASRFVTLAGSLLGLLIRGRRRGRHRSNGLPSLTSRLDRPYSRALSFLPRPKLGGSSA
jgi:hypothetical protein